MSCFAFSFELLARTVSNAHYYGLPVSQFGQYKGVCRLEMPEDSSVEDKPFDLTGLQLLRNLAEHSGLDNITSLRPCFDETFECATLLELDFAPRATVRPGPY